MQAEITMKRVLFLSPRFPPTSAADHQRVRMCLPFLQEFGWSAVVLGVRPDRAGAVLDPLLARTVPEEVLVEWVPAWPETLTRRFGIGSLSFRSWTAIARAGQELLKSGAIDLVFFSTTEFPLLQFGPRWLRQFGVPYVVDIQDPWVSDYYSLHPEILPPGGRLKYAFSQWLARRAEPRVIKEAAHIVCVSPAYPEMFRARYPALPADRFSVLPFGATELDIQVARSSAVSQSVFDPHDGKEHWVYTGRGGPDMAFALRAFFTALKRVADKDPSWRQRLKIHFIGTDYAPAHLARKSVEHMVTEQPVRLPFFESLRCQCDAHALITPGSDDPGYTASKVYPLILTQKPWLAIFHERSSVVDVIRKTKAGTVVTFNSDKELEIASRAIEDEWFGRWPFASPATDWSAFEQYSARLMTKRLCRTFDDVTQGRG
jgi:Glycosyl transferase 4-like domain